MNADQVKAHNDKVAKNYNKFLTLMPKTVLIYQASHALSNVMKPSVRSGGKGNPNMMAHDSSNAAYNWRFSYTNTKSPLLLWDKGHSAVGDKGERRSIDDIFKAEAAVSTRFGIEVNKIYQKYFGAGIDKPSAKLLMYNSIDELNYPKYVYHSQIKGAIAQVPVHVETGAKLAEGVLKSHMSSGTKGTPNTKGLEAILAQTFGNV